MQVNFYTKIVKKESDLVVNQQETINEVLSNTLSNNDFITHKVYQADYYLDTEESTVWTPLNIFTLFNIDKTDCSFIHIQIRNLDIDEINDNNVTFDLGIGSSILNLSQITLLNVSELSEDVIISDIRVFDKTAILNIIVGTK